MSKSTDPSPQTIVAHMLKNDPFSRWMGVEIIEVNEGSCTIRCTVNSSMLNGFQIAHGGIIFSLADTAVAFASATFGRIVLAIDHSISFIKKAAAGDILTAKAETVSMGRKTGVINVEITNDSDELIAVMKGTVYRSDMAIFE